MRGLLDAEVFERGRTGCGRDAPGSGPQQRLRDADYFAGCPVVALTVDSSAERPAMRDLVKDIFGLWHQKLESVLTASGIDDGRARRLATTVIAAAEGAVLLCRAQRSAVPLHDVCDELCALLDAAAVVG